jgi:hypothetical protein
MGGRDRPTQADWPHQAKSDALDAIRAGREALSCEQLACPRQRGQREALRVLELTRAGAVKVAADAAVTSGRCWSPPPILCAPGWLVGPGCGRRAPARR